MDHLTDYEKNYLLALVSRQAFRKDQRRVVLMTVTQIRMDPGMEEGAVGS